jgi:hypothetical protein
VGEIVPVHAMLVFGVADDRFDGGAPSHFPLNLWCDTALLLGCVDLELVIGRRVVAAISGIGMNALDGIAGMTWAGV